MSASLRPERGRGNAFPMSSVITLAFWRLRHTWFLLFVTSLGMIAAVVIICAVPLFANVMTTAGLRNTLRSAPDSAEIALHTGTLGISTPIVNNVRGQFADLFRQNLGSLATPAQFLIQSEDFAFSPAPAVRSSLFLYGTSMQQAASHLGRIQGRLAQATSTGTELDVMMTPQSAQLLHVKPGSNLKFQLSFFTKIPNVPGSDPPAVQKNILITAHIVGLFTIDPANAAYWHGDNFKPQTFNVGRQTERSYDMLVPDASLMAIFEHVRSLYQTDAVYSAAYGYSLYVYYRVDPASFPISSLDTFINQLAGLQATNTALYGDLNGFSETPPQFPYLNSVRLSSRMFTSSDQASNLEIFRSRVDVAQIPLAVLTLLIIALILFFVSLMTNLLVDRQTDTIAILRSRGASGGQIFGALLTQSLGLGIVALVVGLPLSIIIVLSVSRRILPANEQDALNVITNSPVQAAQGIVLYALAIVLVALLTMSISLVFAARMDVLAIRRDAARTARRPLWQRLNLDVIAGVIAVIGYAFSLYLTGIGSVLQGDARTLIVTPLSIVAPFFLMIGCMFLFLRIFPLLLRLIAFLASRGRGAVSMLALAQVARSPRQSIRMTMLLALAIAFTLFTLVYTATQTQHIQDIVTYQVGADFSGSFSRPQQTDAAAVISKYKAIPGVLVASTGYVGQGEGGAAQLPMAVRAVDAETFPDAVIWSSPEAAQTARSLITDLIARRSVGKDVVPAIVDSATMGSLRLHIGSTFTVKVDGLDVSAMHCLLIGTVAHIPTINDRTATTSDKGFTQLGGVLVDYQTYSHIYVQDAKRSKTAFQLPAPPPLNQFWLHTATDPVSLASVRTALARPELHPDTLADRMALLADLNSDPLYLVLGSVLRIGTVTALLLAVVGDLLASWFSARTRLTNFAVLRAIGTTPRQVASVLTWEQAIIYITGLVLGIAFGVFLALTVIPALTFTNLNANLNVGQIYALQSVFPTQIVIPSTLPFALLVLIVIYVVALAMMVRVVSKPSLGQTLRLNED